MLKTLKIILGLALALCFAAPAIASQGSCLMPTTGTVSGLTLVQDINSCLDALQSLNSGATAPTNALGNPNTGQLWYKTSDKSVRVYDGANWLIIGYIDATNHVWDAPVGGGTATVASATTTDLCSVPQSMLTISGTTTITSFSNTCAPGQIKALKFSGALTLTYNATSMILPNGGNNITTVAGDQALAVYLGGGNWSILTYSSATGAALNASSIFIGAVYFNAPISITLTSNQNDWNPSGFSAANVVRINPSTNAVTITGLTAPATDGKTIIIDNVGSTYAITLSNQDASSVAANRLALNANQTIFSGQSITLKYDATAARWRTITRTSTTPTVQVLTSGSGATYTTPVGVTYLRIRMAGGGGGGGAAATNNGTSGSTSSFGSWTAIYGNGGLAGSSGNGGNGGSGGANGTGTQIFRISGTRGGDGIYQNNIGAGGSNSFGGAGVVTGVGGGAALANTGAGGAGGSSSGNDGGGGGGGEFVEFIVPAPSATYTYTVGSAGSGGAAGSNAGGNGAAGRIEVVEFYN